MSSESHRRYMQYPGPRQGRRARNGTTAFHPFPFFVLFKLRLFFIIFASERLRLLPCWTSNPRRPASAFFKFPPLHVREYWVGGTPSSTRKVLHSYQVLTSLAASLLCFFHPPLFEFSFLLQSPLWYRDCHFALPTPLATYLYHLHKLSFTVSFVFHLLHCFPWLSSS